METFRKILNTLFWIVFISGTLVLLVLLIGGAFPISFNPSAQKIKFDIAYFGWEMTDPQNGELKIVHKKGLYKEGFGALQYDYRFRKSRHPGIKSTAIPVEGLTRFKLYMKAKKPGIWQVQIKRKSDNKVFHKNLRVGTKWKHYDFGYTAFLKDTGYSGKFSQVDLRPWIRIVQADIPRYKENTVWIDGIELIR